jgi:NADPH-dependent F420 reductase
MANLPKIAILGGTGDLGSALALRWCAAGYQIIIGSRSKEKAVSLATEMVGNGAIRGEDNVSAARDGDIIVLAIPYANHTAILEKIKPLVEGKIVVDAMVPLVPPKVSLVQLPAEGSAAQIAQNLLGPGARVVSAFHNVGAAKLRGDEPVDGDVLIFGDDKDARAMVIGLAYAAGTRGH